MVYNLNQVVGLRIFGGMDRSHLALKNMVVKSSGKVHVPKQPWDHFFNQELFHEGLKMLRVGEEIMQVTPNK